MNTKVDIVKLWGDEIDSYMTIYIPREKTNDCAILIFPGGGYTHRAPHEGKTYAEFFVKQGILAAVVEYRVFPHLFPEPLQDAQRAIQILRYNALKYGIDKNKIAVMGSSAGGHLAATLATYKKSLVVCEDEISKEEIIPNAQIICYGVLALNTEYAHQGSGEHLLAERKFELGEELSPILIADNTAPQAFIWHTWADTVVPVENSLEYVKKLHSCGVSAELHIFPDGRHGMGLCQDEGKIWEHNAKWSKLMMEWLEYIGFKKGKNEQNI